MGNKVDVTVCFFKSARKILLFVQADAGKIRQERDQTILLRWSKAKARNREGFGSKSGVTLLRYRKIQYYILHSKCFFATRDVGVNTYGKKRRRKHLN